MSRIESDFLGELEIPDDVYYGVQTMRGKQNFHITEMPMSQEPFFAQAYGYVKKAAAMANKELGCIPADVADALIWASEQLIAGKYNDQFVTDWLQGGAGTSTNMNCNEVIAHVGNAQAGETLLHPNDHVNLSQSSNDTFPSALHIAAVTALHTRLEPALTEMLLCLQRLETDNQTVVKTGRTHLQDAVPITFGQEISGWRSMLEHARDMIRASLAGLYELALGGTAVGTGLNAPPGFDAAAAIS